MPLLSTVENSIKKSISICVKNYFTYRINYFAFPLILEMGLIYLEHTMVYDYISSYRLQIDFVITHFVGLNNSCEFLLRMYRFPCTIILKNLLITF